MARRNLVGASLEDISELLREYSLPPYRVRQIYAGIYRRLEQDWDRFTDLGKPLREKLRKRFEIAYPRVSARFQSADGTRRYLFQLSSGHQVETVFIPEDGRDTLCLSTQVGCAVGCLFCATGRLPMRRNLSAGEIIGQVLVLVKERGSSPKRLNIVIMGMGEPLHNYDNVLKSLRLMTDAAGMALPPRRITLSTSGVVPAIERLAAEPIIPNLAISLNATTDEVRNLLVPINRRWNIDALMEACRRFPQGRRRRITVEYVLIGEVNDTPEDAHRLVALLRGLKKKVNLIPLNRDPWVPLSAPSEERVLAFQKILTEHHIAAPIRRPRGIDVSAACGMLAARGQARAEKESPAPRPAEAHALRRPRAGAKSSR